MAGHDGISCVSAEALDELKKTVADRQAVAAARQQ
jgi:hypothetical protein